MAERSRMTLYWSSRSPFVRKVMVMAHETGVVDLIDTKRVLVGSATLSAEVMAVNPLNKIPTLVLASGETIFDSLVICLYFDSLHDGARMAPPFGPQLMHDLTGHALGDGLMQNVVLRLAERNRPADLQSPAHDAAYRAKIYATLDRLEAQADVWLGTRFSLASLAIGCAIAHLEFRYAAENWRDGRPAVAHWFELFSKRPSVKATEYVEIY